MRLFPHIAWIMVEWWTLDAGIYVIGMFPYNLSLVAGQNRYFVVVIPRFSQLLHLQFVPFISNGTLPLFFEIFFETCLDYG